MDPLAGQRRDRPRADQDPAVTVGEQAEGAARVALVGPGPVGRVGDSDPGGGVGFQQLPAGLDPAGPGEPGGALDDLPPACS